MSSTDKATSSFDVEGVRRRRQRTQEIVGGALPTTEERLAAYPPYRDSEAEDRRLFIQSLLLRIRGNILESARDLLELAAVDASVTTLRAARETLLELGEQEAARRLQLYAALAGDPGSAWPIGGYLMTVRSWRFEADAVYRIGLGRALLALHPAHEGALSVASLAASGLADLRTIADWVPRLDAAEERVAETEKEPSETTASLVETVAENRTGPLDAKSSASDLPTAPPASGVVVVPPLDGADTKRTGAAKEVLKQLQPIAGQPLPLREIADPASVKAALLDRFPHFSAELDLVLGQRLPWRLLLVGDPGCGKTELARALAQASEVPFVVYGCAGVADGSFGGTSAQWATARPSVPLQLVQRTRVANPLVVLDELDKTDTDRRNGALVDALLTFLEPSSAKRVMDLGLELEVNLSAVSYVATANKVEDVPPPLRDRLRAIRMPSPTHAHLGTFVSIFFNDIAAERGLDRRWLTDLAQDEAELVRQAWPGGSLRRLKRILELLVEGRQSIMGEA